MGVADITLSQAITQQLNQQEQSIANLEEQVSSGRSLNKPSDNPAAVTQVLQLSSRQASCRTGRRTSRRPRPGWGWGTTPSTACSMTCRVPGH